MELSGEEFEAVKGLDKDGITLQEISQEIDEPLEEIREQIIKDGRFSKSVKELALESKAFQMFDEGEGPGELVRTGFCSAEKAEMLLQEYSDLKFSKETIKKEDDIQDKLATQIGLLGSRLSRLEIKIMNSVLLPKSFECPNCGHEGRYAVALVCKRCENVTPHTPDSMAEITQKGRVLSSFVSEDEEE
ncbi:MAG: hypothetical protein KGY76_05405 [Candidatus Thermoplasmatota archaeon]|nr:hypothetical protein [Candidatus Thermoplasmatota archaeon]